MIVVAALYGTSASTVKIGAGGLAKNVFAETSSTSAANCIDGACWYNYKTKSFGFAPNNYITLNPADVYYATDTTRVSWNLDNGYGGYRAGSAINLNSDSTYRKVIYVKTDPLFRILKNYPKSELTYRGYKECYNQPYSAVTTPEALAACSADGSRRVFVGAVSGSSSTFLVGAGGIAANVFAQTTSANTATLSNGVYWYNVKGKSFGFAPNPTIFLEDADTYDITNTERLSWHVTGEIGGWRAGDVNSLTYDNTYRKVIYVL
jgi:hypothetical protein